MEYARFRKRDDARAAGPLPLGLDLRRRQRARGDGSGVPARRQDVAQAGGPLGRVLEGRARRRPDGHARAGVVPDRRPGVFGDRPRPASALSRSVAGKFIFLGSLTNWPVTEGGALVVEEPSFALDATAVPG